MYFLIACIESCACNSGLRVLHGLRWLSLSPATLIASEALGYRPCESLPGRLPLYTKSESLHSAWPSFDSQFDSHEHGYRRILRTRAEYQLLGIVQKNHPRTWVDNIPSASHIWNAGSTP